MKIFAQMYLIGYLCKGKAGLMERELIFSNEFWSFYKSQNQKVQLKFDYVINIIMTERVITTKFVKHLENTDLYEMRVSLGTNEYRTILFAMDNDNIILSTRILVLNAFQKKSTKDYKKQIEIAQKILGGFTDDTL